LPRDLSRQLKLPTTYINDRLPLINNRSLFDANRLPLIRNSLNHGAKVVRNIEITNSVTLSEIFFNVFLSVIRDIGF
jgi:hypothetical protein